MSKDIEFAANEELFYVEENCSISKVKTLSNIYDDVVFAKCNVNDKILDLPRFRLFRTERAALCASNYYKEHKMNGNF